MAFAEATFEGFVTRKIWVYDDQLRFRLAVPSRNDGPAAKGPRETHFCTIVMPRSMSKSLPVRLEPGMLVRVVTQSISREYIETLERFLKYAEGDLPELAKSNAKAVTLRRIRTEFIARTLVIRERSVDEQAAGEVSATDDRDRESQSLA